MYIITNIIYIFLLYILTYNNSIFIINAHVDDCIVYKTYLFYNHPVYYKNVKNIMLILGSYRYTAEDLLPFLHVNAIKITFSAIKQY